MQWLPVTCVGFQLPPKTPDAQVVSWCGSRGVLGARPTARLGERPYPIELLPARHQHNSPQLGYAGLLAQYASLTLAAAQAIWRTLGRPSRDTIGKPQQNHDPLIAAIATVQRLTQVNHNNRHFQHTGIQACSP